MKLVRIVLAALSLGIAASACVGDVTAPDASHQTSGTSSTMPTDSTETTTTGIGVLGSGN